MPYRLIDPDETLDYSCDWTAFLEDAGSPTDAIQTSAWSIVPAGPTLSGERLGANVASVFVAGTALGRVYRLTNQISTLQGRTAERSVTLRCENR
ncbi:MAG: hypothetical protein IIC53_12145 [Proteobacteria bacterium]|nr:hypothetical protein [Pseudomonadota bacterium]